MASRNTSAHFRSIASRIARRPRDVLTMRARLRELEQRLRRAEDEQAARAERDWQNAKRYAMAYRRLLATALDTPPESLGVAPTTAPSPDKSRADRELIRTLRVQSRFVESLRRGAPIEDVLVAFVRDRLQADDHLPVRSLCQSLQTNPATRTAGYLGSALVALATHTPALAWDSMREVPPALWRRLAAREYFRAGFQVDPTAAAAVARELVDDPPADLPPDGWIALVKAALGAGDDRLAGDALAVADALAGKAPGDWAATDGDRDSLRPWIERALRPAPAPRVPADHVAVAVLDYKQPDPRQTSKNIGDYVQTLASVGHLVRHQRLRFHGDPQLAALADELRARVRPELRLDTAARDVTLVPVNRDASGYDPVPEGTWALAFGWYMESIFGRYDFPLHPHLRPILVSFHCNRPALLTPEAIGYLRRYGPVGCRDWTTVDLLLGLGVPAFFSGCLTTTVHTVFPDLAADETPAADAPVGYVDTRTPEGAPRLTQEDEEVRRDGLVANLRRAVVMLEGYRRRYSAVVTSRLHCYLPSRSLGMAAEFKPHAPVDIRFDGLLHLTDEAYAAIQRGLLVKLAGVLDAVLAGRTEEQVYEVWRDLCAEDVAEAEARRAAVPAIPPPSFDVAAACTLIRGRQVDVPRTTPGDGAPETHVALALDGNLKRELKVVIEAMAANSTGPLHLWILCRDHTDDDYRRLAALFPAVSFSWLPCDAVDYGPVLGMLKHITVSTMDRLLLPDLLPERDRIVYHDIDALPLGDVTELYRWDLGGHPLAARSAVATDADSGFRNIRISAKRLRANPAKGYECIRREYARHGADFTAFNAGILVLDLARMRADAFSREFIPYVERYGMNDQEVLNCYAGPNRAVLPPQWNSFPTQEIVTDPRIIHWAGPLKPWRPAYVLFREAWREYAQRVRDREAVLFGEAAVSPAGEAAVAPSPLVPVPPSTDAAASADARSPEEDAPPSSDRISSSSDDGTASDYGAASDDGAASARPAGEPPMHVRAAVAMAWVEGRDLDLSACDYGPGVKGQFRSGPTDYYYFLAGLAKIIPARTIVEVGTHFGGSARAFAEGQRAAGLPPHVLTYDVEDRAGPPVLGFDGVERVLADIRHPEGKARLVEWLGSAPIDLLYIDALKDSVFVESTLAALADQPVGWLVCDDIFATPSIRGAWDRIRQQYGDRAVTLDEVLRGARSGGYGQGIVAPANLATSGLATGDSAALAPATAGLRDAAHRKWSGTVVSLRAGGLRSRDESPQAVLREAVAACTGHGEIVVVGPDAATTRTLAGAVADHQRLAGVSTNVIGSFPDAGSLSDPHYEPPVHRQEPSTEEFRRQLGEAAAAVNLFAGDVPSLRWPGRPIELLLLTWSRDPTYLSFAWRELLPWCIPGGSLILVDGMPDGSPSSAEEELGTLRPYVEVLGTGRNTLALAAVATPDREAQRTLASARRSPLGLLV